MDPYFGLHSFFYFRRPVKDEGDSVTAFESDVLGAPERLGVLIVGGAIVGSENDQRIVGYLMLVEKRQALTYLLVQVSDLSHVIGQMFTGDWGVDEIRWQCQLRRIVTGGISFVPW